MSGFSCFISITTSLTVMTSLCVCVCVSEGERRWVGGGLGWKVMRGYHRLSQGSRPSLLTCITPCDSACFCKDSCPVSCSSLMVALMVPLIRLFTCHSCGCLLACLYHLYLGGTMEYAKVWSCAKPLRLIARRRRRPEPRGIPALTGGVYVGW